MEPNFWKGDHPNNHLVKEFEPLMPPSGAADTLEGELYRAAIRLVYDCYNNGFCNDNSGALEFLVEHDLVTVRQYQALEPYMWGARFRENIFENATLLEAVNAVCDRVLCHIRDKAGDYTQTSGEVDMWDWTRPEPEEFKYDEDEDDDYDD